MNCSDVLKWKLLSCDRRFVLRTIPSSQWRINIVVVRNFGVALDTGALADELRFLCFCPNTSQHVVRQ